MLGTIFRKAQNKIQDPAKLERLIKMIDKEQWSTLPADVKGDIYEGLLEAAPAIPGSRGTRTSMFIAHAQDVKGGAGQHYTLAYQCLIIPKKGPIVPILGIMRIGDAGNFYR